LAKQAYLTGEEVSLADIFHIPYAQMAQQNGGEELFAKHPNVSKWLAKLTSSEAWIKAQPQS
jgi:glutathione S-transferase